MDILKINYWWGIYRVKRCW